MQNVRRQFIRCAQEAQQRGLTLVVSNQGFEGTGYGLRTPDGPSEWFETIDGVEGYLRGLEAAAEGQQLRRRHV